MALTRPHDPTGKDPLLTSEPGRDAAILLVHDPVAALSRLSGCWCSRCSVSVLGVTGSNGKTTTKDLARALLESLGAVHATSGNLNNALGLPLTLLGLRERHRWAVVEMGASAPGDIDRLARLARPRVGVITNASVAHLEGFGSLDAVIATKGEMLDHLPPDGAAVLNRDSRGYDAWIERAGCSVHSWGSTAGDNRWSWRVDPVRGPRLEFAGETIAPPLPGRHNAANLVAAVVAVQALTGEELDIPAALAHLRSSPHRSHLLQVADATVMDDSYNANPESVLAAAMTLAELPGTGRTLAILGVMAELGDTSARQHHDTGLRLAEMDLDEVWTVGEAAREIARGAEAGGIASRTYKDTAAAAAALSREIAAGDRVLVKGSRSARMERVIEEFTRLLETGKPNLERT